MMNTYYSQYHEGRIGGDIIGNLTRGCVIDRLRTMRNQENTIYNYRNYEPPSGSPSLPPGQQPQQQQPQQRPLQNNIGPISGGSINDDTMMMPPLNSSWREKICHWSFNVIDHFDLSREVVAVSLSLFDRYLATRGNRCNGSTALLASLTTLHIAIKVHEVRKIKLTTLANLSRGQFGPRHIEEMEWKVLNALKWHIHPPTAMAFLSHLLLLLPPQVNDASKEEIYALSRYITELSVCDSSFVEIHPSAIAFSAVLNTFEDRRYRRLISPSIRDQYLRAICSHVGLRQDDEHVLMARPKLKRLLTSSLGPDSLPGDTSGNGGGSSVGSAGGPAGSGGVAQAQQYQEYKADDSSLSSRQSRLSRRSRSSSYDSANNRRRVAPVPQTAAQSSPIPNNISGGNYGNNDVGRPRSNPSPGRMSTSPCSMSSRSTNSRFNRLSPIAMLGA